MNEADLPSINLDELRLVPDWLRADAPNPSKQYASFDRAPETDYMDRRGPRPGGPRRDSRDSRPGGERRNDRGRSGPPPRGGGGRGRDERPPARQENYQPVAPAPIRIEFLPDERCMASIIKQIRSTHMAYPLFSLARMFLQEPARHYLQLSLVPGASQPGTSLYQLGGDGPVTLDRAALEAIAFDAMKERFYKEESVQKDPPKGNFTNVARERSSGTLLGPTNYHGYQPALRSLYESRFSRRMTFEDYRRNIEISSDPALVEQWKEAARTATTISTIEGEPATVFPSNAETRVHFRQNHLEALLHKGMSFRLHGSVARRLPEPAVMQAIREAHEREVRYPAQFVQLLRQGLQNAGLHIFKHRKRIVYVAVTRPTPFIASNGAVAENVSLILETIAKSPLCTRKFLAERVLSKQFGNGRRRQEAIDPVVQPAIDSVVSVSADISVEAGKEVVPVEADSPLTNLEHDQILSESSAEPEKALSPDVTTETVTRENPAPRAEDAFSKAKAALAGDLRFLVQAGHIIEFHNSTFDLPLPPKAKEEPVKARSSRQTAAQDDTINSIGADPASVQEEGPSEIAEESPSSMESDAVAQEHEKPGQADNAPGPTSEGVDAGQMLPAVADELAGESSRTATNNDLESGTALPTTDIEVVESGVPDGRILAEPNVHEDRPSEEKV